MSYSGDNSLPQSPLSTPHPTSSDSNQRLAMREWAQLARREIEARLDAIQRAANGLAASANERQRAGISAIEGAASDARDALATLDTLLALRDAPLRMASVEVSDLLMAALSRWKTRAPQHTFELALPGHEPALVGDISRIEAAIDALIAWMVASSPGGDVRVALRYASPADFNAAGAGEEALVSVRGRLRPELQLSLGESSVEETTRVALSLTLAREAATAHGGRIWMNQEPDAGGCSLNLALPTMPSLAQESADTALTGLGDGRERDEPGAVASPSLPLARQRRVALAAYADPRMARYLRVNLERAGYRALTAADLASAMRQIDAEEPDIVLLDAALDTSSAQIPLYRALARTTAPVILLTREANPAQATAALDAGAADVIALPFSIEETLARVRRALRSAPVGTRGTAGGVTICGDLAIDEAERRVTLAGAPIMLSKTEYRLLRTLARHAGKTVAHETLLEQVWGPAYNQEYEFIWVYIRRLRRKIEPDPARPRYIMTAPGVGYFLAAPVAAPANS